MRKISELLDRKILVYLYIIGMLIIRDILIDVFYVWKVRSLWNAFTIFFAVYTVVIVLYEIKNKSVIAKKEQILPWLYLGIAIISTLLQTEGNRYKSIVFLMLFLMKIYLFYSFSMKEGKEKTDQILMNVSKIVMIAFFVQNMASLVIFLLYQTMNIELSGVFAYSSMYTTTNHQGSYQFFGLYEWMTDMSCRCLLCVCLGLFLYDRKKIHRNLMITNTVSSLAMIWMGGGRAGMIATIVLITAIIYRLLRTKTSLKRAILLLIILFMAGGLAIAILKFDTLCTYWQLYRTDFSEFIAVLDSKSNGRFSILSAVVTAWADKPFFGYGWVCIPQKVADLLGWSVVTYTHSVLLSVLLFTGIIGFTVFVLWMGQCIFKMVKNRRLISITNSFWLPVYLICEFILASFDPGILGEDSHIESSFFWLFLGYIVYLDYIFTKKKKECIGKVAND